MGSLERYFGEYGRVCENKEALRSPVSGSFPHAKRLADEHEQQRISACYSMFIAILTYLTSKLEASR